MGVLDLFKSPARSVAAPARRAQGDDDDLFDDEFQRKLEYLALVSRRVFAGRMRAERRTKKSGSGVEFADHRDYQPGDDFRYLDWNVYQRFDRLLIRLYEEEEDLTIYFIVDTSASMGFGDGEEAPLRQARSRAALAYVGLANLDRVAHRHRRPTRSAGRMPATRGKARIFKVFRFLRELEADGHDRSRRRAEDLRRAAQAPRPRRARSAISTIRAGFERGINVLRYNKFEPFVVHVVDPREAQARAPRRRARLRLRDRRRARGHRHRQGARALRRGATRSTSTRSSASAPRARCRYFRADVERAVRRAHPARVPARRVPPVAMLFAGLPLATLARDLRRARRRGRRRALHPEAPAPRRSPCRSRRSGSASCATRRRRASSRS